MVAVELRQANKEGTGVKKMDAAARWLPRFISQVFDLAQVPGKGMGSSLFKLGTSGEISPQYEQNLRFLG